CVPKVLKRLLSPNPERKLLSHLLENVRTLPSAWVCTNLAGNLLDFLSVFLKCLFSATREMSNKIPIILNTSNRNRLTFAQFQLLLNCLRKFFEFNPPNPAVKRCRDSESNDFFVVPFPCQKQEERAFQRSPAKKRSCFIQT